jgi:hypothetical protein
MTEQEQRIKDLEAQLTKAKTRAMITDATLADLYSSAWADGWKACLELFKDNEAVQVESAESHNGGNDHD